MSKPKKSKEDKENVPVQPEINIGLVGHVDHGKTTITERLSGKWTDEHSEELKRGITIRLGYADALFYKCPQCEEPKCYQTSAKCEECKSKCAVVRKVSFVDAPGHETLMATMLSGAAIMDAAILLIAANEPCPQPQTKEHLMALEIIGVKQIIIVQNKIDLVSEEEALKNYEQIKAFVKGTIAEKALIIPISAQHNTNINFLIQTIVEHIKIPKRSIKKDPLFIVARSFDVNRPGSSIKDLLGGVLGGALKQGVIKNGQKVEIRPGLKKEKDGKKVYQPIETEITGIKTGGKDVDEAGPGGSLGLLTTLDPSIVKTDSLTGNIIGLPDKLPPMWYEFNLKPHLLVRVVGVKDDLLVEPIKKGELLMINVNSSATVGAVSDIAKDRIHVNLRKPICADKTERITISRNLGSRWRLIGYCEIID